MDYSNYIKGKNLTGTIDIWVKSLDTDNRRFINFLQRHSRDITKGGEIFATLSAIIGCILFIPNNSSSTQEISYLAGYSVAFVYASLHVGRILSGMIEKNIDRHEGKKNISIIKGDKTRDRKAEKKNSGVIRNAAFFGVGIIVQISCSIAASYIFETFKNGSPT